MEEIHQFNRLALSQRRKVDSFRLVIQLEFNGEDLHVFYRIRPYARTETCGTINLRKKGSAEVLLADGPKDGTEVGTEAGEEKLKNRFKKSKAS